MGEKGPSFKVNLTELVQKIAVIKRKIIIFLYKYEQADSVTNVDLHAMTTKLLKEVEEYDARISAIYCARDDGEICEDHLNEIVCQSDYSLDVTTKLSKLKTALSSSVQTIEGVAKGASNYELKLPNLICGVFTGDSSNSLEFSSFLTQFNNIVGLRGNLSNSTKFTYLRTYLRGYALKVVQHLQVTDDNYLVALTLLEREFLNKDCLTDDLFAKLLILKPKSDSTFLETKLFMNEVRCVVSDLKQYGTDLLEGDTCIKLHSLIVFSKLPFIFKQELARKLDNNFPTVQQVFDNYVEIIRTLNLRNISFQKSVDLK